MRGLGQGALRTDLCPARASSLTRICSCPFLHESGESSLSSARHTPIWHFTTSWTWGQQVSVGPEAITGPLGYSELCLPPQAPRWAWKESSVSSLEGWVEGALTWESRDQNLALDLQFLGLPWWLRGKESTCQCSR